MQDIGKKSIAELIDALMTTSQKCFRAQDEISNPDAQKALAAARMAQAMNKRRCDLMRAIDERLGESGITVSEKTY